MNPGSQRSFESQLPHRPDAASIGGRTDARDEGDERESTRIHGLQTAACVEKRKWQCDGLCKHLSIVMGTQES
jgi:hypothetical protein